MTVYVDSAFHPYGRMIMFADTREEWIQKAVLFEYYKMKGMKALHFCPDWDYMVAHSLSPEFQACTCDKAALT